MELTDITNWLREVEHPAKGDKNIVELGMVENIEISGSTVTVTLGFAKHRDPLAEYLIGSAKAAVIRNAPEGTAVEVKTIVKEAAPAKKKPGLDLGFEEIEGVKHIIGIASGKGGVGKSNTSINLALQFKKKGKRVIILDADFGMANIEVMFGTVPKHNLSDLIYKGKNIL